MSIAEEEADETEYWLELLNELQHAPEAPLNKLRDEAHQITSMLVASVKAAREKQWPVCPTAERTFPIPHSGLRTRRVIRAAILDGVPRGDEGAGGTPIARHHRHS